jgi:hypothetical protein
MIEWQKRISGCFGAADKKFALHPMDEKRAFELLTQLRKEKVSWLACKQAMEAHLSDVSQEHKAKEMERIEATMKPWLN